MATIYEMLQKVQAVNLATLAGQAISTRTGELVRLQREQLLEGKDSTGKMMSPKYSEDPYFKKPGAALKYAQWKKRLYPQTPFDVPNLIITGKLHSSIVAGVSGGSVRFDATVEFAQSVADKYRNEHLGLDEEKRMELWQEIKPEVVQMAAAIIGCKIN